MNAGLYAKVVERSTSQCHRPDCRMVSVERDGSMQFKPVCPLQNDMSNERIPPARVASLLLLCLLSVVPKLDRPLGSLRHWGVEMLARRGHRWLYMCRARTRSMSMA